MTDWNICYYEYIGANDPKITIKSKTRRPLFCTSKQVLFIKTSFI